MFTKRYVKMCEKARGIIPESGFFVGDFILTPKGNIDVVTSIYEVCKGKNRFEQWCDVTGIHAYPSKKCIKIYRLDQLVEMFRNNFEAIPLKNGKWEVYVGENYSFYDVSIEEGYFQGCMAEKYGKEWDDEKEEWVDE